MSDAPDSDVQDVNYTPSLVLGGGRSVTESNARRVGDELGINWSVVSPKTFRHALEVELEHSDVTHGDLMTTGRIALDHLREYPDYYKRHDRMERGAEAYWASREKPSPTLGGGLSGSQLWFAAALLLVLIVVAFFAWRFWKKSRGEGLTQPIFRDALGYSIPLPGDPDRNIMRRSQPYPPGRYPRGGLADFYVQYDPAYSTAFEADYCWHLPVACAGMALEPFRSAL